MTKISKNTIKRKRKKVAAKKSSKSGSYSNLLDRSEARRDILATIDNLLDMDPIPWAVDFLKHVSVDGPDWMIRHYADTLLLCYRETGDFMDH